MTPDCGCTIHPGESHDQHMDRLWRERNRAILERADDPTRNGFQRWLSLVAYAKEEEARLSHKLTWMTRG